MKELILNNDNFEELVLGATKPVLVDFWATWCGPCRMLAPIIEEIAHDYDGKVKVGKINVDEEEELAVKFGIQSIPTVLLFKNGEIADKSIGYKQKAHFEAMLG